MAWIEGGFLIQLGAPVRICTVISSFVTSCDSSKNCWDWGFPRSSCRFSAIRDVDVAPWLNSCQLRHETCSNSRKAWVIPRKSMSSFNIVPQPPWESSIHDWLIVFCLNRHLTEVFNGLIGSLPWQHLRTFNNHEPATSTRRIYRGNQWVEETGTLPHSRTEWKISSLLWGELPLWQSQISTLTSKATR